MRARGIDTTYVVGFSTSGCVRASALDALQHGFRPLVVAEACGDRDAATHDQNLFDLDAKYADVISEAEVTHEPRSTPMTVIDLDSPDLTWIEHAIAGSDKPARLSMLHADEARGTRTVLVKFPDGWRRDAVGHQPAGEEMLILSGALTLSGLTAGVGQYLVVEPRATRSATSVADGSSAVVFFSGPGGGWADGEADDAGTVSLVRVAAGEIRDARPGLVGSTTVDADIAGRVFDTDTDICWPAARRFAHVPAGTPAPDVAGQAVIRLL